MAELVFPPKPRYRISLNSSTFRLRSIAHIGTIISTTAVALGEHLRCSGAALSEAMVLGYEIVGRIDESLTPGRMQRGFHGPVSTGARSASRCTSSTPWNALIR